MIPEFVLCFSYCKYPHIDQSISNVNKNKYTTHYEYNQQNESDTIKYNYIETKDYIDSNIQKYQDIIW